MECEHLNKGLHILPSANLIPLGFVEICGEILYTSAEYKIFKRERERERERVGERGKRELEIKRRFGSNATSDREKNKREEGIRAKEREKQS